MEMGGAEVILSSDVMRESGETFEIQFPHKEFILKDIREFDLFPSVDIVTGGYPCQPFSMGGNRAPKNDPRTYLFREFSRVVDQCNPKFFIAENVSGLKSVQNGHWLKLQLDTFSDIGQNGYNISWQVLNAQDYGVPQRRKRLFIVGVRKDLALHYHFPNPTHGDAKTARKYELQNYASHGVAIGHLISRDPKGEFYERPHDPSGHFSWYYMSRNRKADWIAPSFTIVANLRHMTLHPASPKMELEWSNLADKFKQKWRFSDVFEHYDADPKLPKFETPRRLTWREAAAIQTFPSNFEVAGKLEKKFEQLGNAVPPLSMKAVASNLINQSGLKSYPPANIGEFLQ